jgi:parvulin-like peptidyl-prolyl isomerase
MAEGLISEINKGANFTQLAARFSDVNAATGGVGDYVSKEDFPPQVSDAMFKLKIDEVSPLIETEKDYRIVRVLDKIESAKNIDSPELQNRIKKILFDKKLQDGLNKLGEDLVKKADIWVDPAIGFSWNDSLNTTSPR